MTSSTISKDVPVEDSTSPDAQGIEGLAYNAGNNLFYAASRDNNNVYAFTADTGGDGLNDCEVVRTLHTVWSA